MESTFLGYQHQRKKLALGHHQHTAITLLLASAAKHLLTQLTCSEQCMGVASTSPNDNNDPQHLQSRYEDVQRSRRQMGMVLKRMECSWVNKWRRRGETEGKKGRGKMGKVVSMTVEWQEIPRSIVSRKAKMLVPKWMELLRWII